MQIRVNAVNPTVVNAGMGVHVWENELKLADDLRARIPLRQFAGLISTHYHIIIAVCSWCYCVL